MSTASRYFRAVTWLLIVAVLTTAIVLVFRYAAQPASSSEGAATAPPSSGYPAPTSSVPLPTPLPPGYPPPPTPLPTQSETEIAASLATEFAAATASAPAPPTPIGVVIGPQTFQNSTGQFQIALLPGWWAWSIGTTSIKNYDDEALGGEGDYPPGGLKIQIEVVEMPPGQSVEQWVSEFIANVKTAYQDSSRPGLSFTEPHAYVLGSHNGISYTIGAQPSIMEVVLPQSDSRLIIIALMPSDSPALPEALSMLSTLVVLPE
jgi:hypothetical protein